MATITQALVDGASTGAGVNPAWNSITRTVTDTDANTEWGAGTYDFVSFVYTACDQGNITGAIFNDCTFTGNNVFPMRMNSATALNQGQFNRCVFINAGGTANGETLFGEFAGTQFVTSRDSEWIAFGDDGAFPRRWSFALNNVNATLINPTFNDSFITDSFVGPINFGWNHDGTTRANATDGLQRFSIRNQQTAERWCAYVQGTFAAGTYTDDINDATAGVHYNTNLGGTVDIYTINQVFQNWSTTANGTSTYVINALTAGAAKTFHEGYTWNPRFISAGTVADFITDAVILSIPAGVTAFTLDLDNIDQSALPPAFTGGSWVGNEGNVLFLETDSATSSNTANTTVDKCLDANGDLIATYVVTPRVKSFTNVGGTTTTALNLFESYTGGVEGDFVAASTSDTFFAADGNLAGETLAANLGAAQAAITDDSGLIYPSLKSVWYYGTVDEDYEPTIPLGVFTTTKTLDLGAAQNSYVAGALGLRTAAIITASDDVNGISASTITIAGRGFNGIAINGATTGDFGAITNNSNIVTTDAAAQTVASIGGSNFNTQGAVTVTTNVNGSTFTTGGDTTISGNAEDSNIDSGGTLTIAGTSIENMIESDSHCTITGAASTTAITSGARIQLDGGSTDVTGTSSGHFDVNAGTHTRLTANTLGTSDLRANGALVILEDCDLTSLDLINISNATVNEGSLTAPTINCDSTNLTQTVSNVDISATNLNNCTAGRFTTGMVYGANTAGGTLNINFTSVAANVTVDDVLGTGWSIFTDEVTGDRDTVIINSTTAVSIQVEDVANAPFQAGTNVTLVEEDLIIRIQAGVAQRNFAYRLQFGTTQATAANSALAKTFGVVDIATELTNGVFEISLSSTEIGTGNQYFLTVTGPDLVEIRTGGETFESGASRDYTLQMNPTFNLNAAGNPGVTVNAAMTTDTVLQVNVNSGIQLTGSILNASMGALKNNQVYCDFISRNGTDYAINFPTAVNTQFVRNTADDIGINFIIQQQTAGDAAMQGAQFVTTIGDNPELLSAGTQGTFDVATLTYLPATSFQAIFVTPNIGDYTPAGGGAATMLALGIIAIADLTIDYEQLGVAAEDGALSAFATAGVATTEGQQDLANRIFKSSQKIPAPNGTGTTADPIQS